MLSKLLKYDFKALRRILLPLLLCVICLSILSSISLTILLRWDGNDSLYTFGQIIGSVFVAFVVMGIVASTFVVAVIIIVHFYRNFVSNEAYLTFTLPVTIKDHMLSKMISGYAWLMLSGLVTIFSLFIIAVFGTADSGFINTEIISSIYTLFASIFSIWNYKLTIMVILIFIIIFIAPMAVLLQYYTAIVIGGVVAKKNKLLASIGFIFLINMVVQTLYQVLYFITVYMNINESYDDIYRFSERIITNLNISLLFYIVIFIGLGITFYITSKRLLENKLNLE